MPSPRRMREGRHWKKIRHRDYRFQTLRPMHWLLLVQVLPKNRPVARLGTLGTRILAVRRDHEGDEHIHIEAGYAWNGATGAIDTPSFRRASLIHDGLYQLMREGVTCYPF
ncbi:MAG: hypothetical protein MPN21_14515 [Thermoanaerobaculia bacterium]|nr:hypothetical protein [Thermoanaerobaculia bacterium]